MKQKNLIITALLLVFSLAFFGFSQAQDSQTTKTPANTPNIQHGPGFIDKNGDGYNDQAPDHDGDGIPNGLDGDYSGPKNRSGRSGQPFVDLNGDGINDNNTSGKGNRGGKGKGGFGPGDGTGNRGIGPRDGSGLGAKTGVCDGNGPKGRNSRGAK